MNDSILLCGDEDLATLMTQLARDEAGGTRRLAQLLDAHRSDPRLHFLQGSLMAGGQNYPDALKAMRQAVALAPDYAIARFQLGLLELSSADAAAADATLAPLAEADGDGPLNLFARGLRLLARDELISATALLRRGIAVNQEHPLVSRDMELILERIAEGQAAAPAAGAVPVQEDISAAHLLLREYAAKSTKH